MAMSQSFLVARPEDMVHRGGQGTYQEWAADLAIKLPRPPNRNNWPRPATAPRSLFNQLLNAVRHPVVDIDARNNLLVSQGFVRVEHQERARHRAPERDRLVPTQSRRRRLSPDRSVHRRFDRLVYDGHPPHPRRSGRAARRPSDRKSVNEAGASAISRCPLSDFMAAWPGIWNWQTRRPTTRVIICLASQGAGGSYRPTPLGYDIHGGRSLSKIKFLRWAMKIYLDVAAGRGP